MTDPTLLRRAIESVGIEKPSDYTLVLEEVERLMEVERQVASQAPTREQMLLAALGHAWFKERLNNGMKVEQARIHTQAQIAEAVAYLKNLHREEDALIRAATDLVQEMEEMGYGKTSDRALPGSWDTMLAALAEVKK